MNKRFNFLTLFCVCLFVFANQVAAKDTWINVRSKNFNLIGNASEKDIRGVATKLEQFRETFRQLFPKARFNASIETNVVVFKNDSSYNPFKPKRANGKADKWIAGYFQSGEDLNYITLSTDGDKEDAYGTIFHEYVHFLLDTNFGKSEVPPWFNEGLAEFYQTFKIEKRSKSKSRFASGRAFTACYSKINSFRWRHFSRSIIIRSIKTEIIRAAFFTRRRGF